MQILATIPDTLQLIESNLGDGYWSLHDARDTDAMIAEGDSRVLASGCSSVLAIDVAHASAMLAGHSAHVGNVTSRCDACVDAAFARL
jgi:hypothetical protein